MPEYHHETRIIICLGWTGIRHQPIHEQTRDTKNHQFLALLPYILDKSFERWRSAHVTTAAAFFVAVGFTPTLHCGRLFPAQFSSSPVYAFLIDSAGLVLRALRFVSGHDSVGGGRRPTQAHVTVARRRATLLLRPLRLSSAGESSKG